MCDCFHLAFPNWHGPATGAGRRLRGPEQDTEDDSVCEEPEILEGERPRPQGSSPVDEFPNEKQGDEDRTLPHKGGSKKSRRVGFGSLFDKRSSAKMSDTENIQSDEADVIVKTVKEACAEGLVVTGGGKDGIFIKEVKPDSPASKHLTAKEGDQILSATVYFDNVSYEDALQILEHAQPYKMEFCLRRKLELTLEGDAENIHTEKGGSPKMRRSRKKKQDRISWPKFPSFGKGHRAQFKRSHSTSEAEEHKKLEMSPPTSDTESPLKSPLKSPDEKDKKKRQKMKLKTKGKGHRSKSVEEPQRNVNELTSENLIVLEDQHVGDVLEAQFLENPVTKLLEVTQDIKPEAEYEDLSKTEEDYAFPNLSGMESNHEVHLISLGNTLKTTDITDAIVEGFPDRERTQEEGNIEISEMKVSIHQKKSEIGIDSQSKTISKSNITSESFANDNVVVSPVVISQAEVETSHLDTDINTEVINKVILEKNLEFGITEVSMPKLDVSSGSTDIRVLKQSPRAGSEKQRKEITIFENESYGIRTRGPLADIATSKTHFANTVNGLQLTPPDSSERTNETNMQYAVDAKDLHIDTKSSKPPTETNIDTLAGLDKRSELKFKLPKVSHESIKMTKVERIMSDLPKREDIEIPGMEDKSKPDHHTHGMKLPKLEKIINITKEREIQSRRTDDEFNVEDVKEAVSKFPSFKLPEGDITGVLVQREITIMEMKADKTNTTPRESPRKISGTSSESSTKISKSTQGKEESSASNLVVRDKVMKIPKVDLDYADVQTITVTTMDTLKPKDEAQQAKTDKVLNTNDRKAGDVKFNLPKREDIEIPGMEAIKESVVQNTDRKVDKVDNEMSERHKTKKYGDHKGHEKKPKKTKISMPSFGITKPDIRFPDIGIELPKKDVYPKKDTGEVKETKLEEDAEITLPKVAAPSTKECTVEQPTYLTKDLAGKVPKASVDISVVDAKEAKTSQPITDWKTSAEVPSVNLEMKAQDIKTEGQGRKFKLPKFDISFPEVKAPKIYATSSKKEVDASRDGELESDVNIPYVDASLPEGSTEVEEINADITVSKTDVGQKDPAKFGSPTKFKLPSFNLPKFKGKTTKGVDDISAMDVEIRESLAVGDISVEDIHVKESKMTLPDAELNISADIKKTDIDKDQTSSSMDMDAQEIQTEGHGIKFKLPKFGIRLPELKVPKIDLNVAKTELEISLPEGVKADVPEIDSKDFELKTKQPTLFHRFGFSKPEVKVTDADVSLPNDGVSLPEVSAGDGGQKDETTFSSPTKFKLPSITLPKFGAKAPDEVEVITAVNVQVKGPEISLAGTETKLPTETQSADIKDPDLEKEEKYFSGGMKSQNILSEEQGSTFKLPKFGISLPEMKGPKLVSVGSSAAKTEADMSLPEEKMELEPLEVSEATSKVKTDVPEKYSKCIEVKTKQPSFSFPKIVFSKSEIKVSEADISLQGDVSVTEGSLDNEGPNADITVSMGGTKQIDETKFCSPINVQLPSTSLVKLETKGTETSVGDAQAKGTKISLPNAKLSESLLTDITGTDTDKKENFVLKSQEMQIEEQESKFKLPKFGISLPEVKGPKIDISTKKAEIDISKSEIKASADISLPKDDASFPEGTIDLEKTNTEITASMDGKDKVKSGSPTKFKLPSITLPKFGIKSSKDAADFSDVDVKAKGHEIPDAEFKLQVEYSSSEIKQCDEEKEIKSLVDVKEQDIQSQQQGGKINFPKFGISFPEVKGPKLGSMGSSAAKTEIDNSLPEGKIEVCSFDVEVPQGKIKGPEADISLPNVPLPEGHVDMETPNTDITVSVGDKEQKDEEKFGSPTKFKLPSITLPKFGAKATKETTDTSAVDVQAKIPEISVPGIELSTDIKVPDIDKDKPLIVDMKAQDTDIEGKGSKFKLPKFGISLPDVKGPKVDYSASKKEMDMPIPERKMEVQPPDTKLSEATPEVKADVPEKYSKGIDVKTKRPSFSFPKFGFSKSELKVSEAAMSLPNVDVSLPEVSGDLENKNTDITAVSEGAQKDSSAKFKLPTISLPKLGTKTLEISVEDVPAEGHEISLPDAELQLLSKPLSTDIKGTDTDKKEEPLIVDNKPKEIQIEEQESKFKLTKFGISLPEVKGPKIDLSSPQTKTDISLSDSKMDEQPPDAIKGKSNVPDVDSKDLDMQTKRSGFSFPKFGFSKSDMKVPEADVSLPNVDVSLPKENVELQVPNKDIAVSVGDSGQKDEAKFGSPTKFKLPSITLPRFGAKSSKADVSAVDVQSGGPEISLPEADIKLTSEPLSADIKVPDINKDEKSLSADMKAHDMQVEGKGSKFKLPKFGIGLPEVKVPKIELSASKTDTDICLPGAKTEVHPPQVDVSEKTFEVRANLPEVQSKGFNLTTKQGFSFPKIGLSESEIKGPETDLSVSNVHVPLKEGSVDLAGPNTEITVSVGDSGQKDETKFGSPTKFKLPSITLPKFGAKAPKGKVEVPAVDVQSKRQEILPDAELKMSAGPLSSDIKRPDIKQEEKTLNVKTQDIQIEGKESKFKLPKFEISLPEAKGPKIDSSSSKTEVDISLPKGKMEVHQPDAELSKGGIVVKADVPEVDSKGLNVKTKQPSFSLPKFGFSKSDMKAPEADVSNANVDVSLPEGEVDIEVPSTDITMPMDDAEQKEKTKFGSPIKFKFPTITLPKFGTKAPKGAIDIPVVDVQPKGQEISLPDTELKLSAEAPSADIKGPYVDKEKKSLSVNVKTQDIQIEEKESKFKVSKFGISLPEVKGPEINSGASKKDIDICLPEASMEVHSPHVELPEGTIKVKAGVPDVELKGFDEKTKQPGFSFPKLGISTSEMKAPEPDVNLPNVDVPLPEGSVDLKGQNTDITVSVGDSGQKDETKFGSPTKFKLPSISLPKFGVKAPKGAVEIPAVDVQSKGQEINLPEAELKLSADMKASDVDKEEKSLSVDVKIQDNTTEVKGDSFKLPKFGISLPEIKGPKIDSSSSKTEVDISLPEANLEVQPPDAGVTEGAIVVKADVPEVDSKGLDVKTKQFSFSFPKFGFSKSDMKAPEADVSHANVDVSLPEGEVDIEVPSTDIATPMDDVEQKEKTKFGSPIKFKLPTITFPKFGTKAPKGAIDIPVVDVQPKGQEISLPDTELKLSAEAPSADIKGSDVDKEKTSLSVNVKTQDIQIKEKGSKFKVPKFGISLPEVKGPEISSGAPKKDIDVCLPEASMEVHSPHVELPEGTIKVKADIPAVDFKGLTEKTKQPGFSFPKVGLSTSEMKAPEANVNLPNVDVPLPEGSVDLKGQNTDITVSVGDSGQKDETKFGSPTKFKLPSISLPKFGVKAPKGAVEIPAVDVQSKGQEINLPEAEVKLSADMKGPDVDKDEKYFSVDVKIQDNKTEGKGSSFKLPKFEISLPDVKGPKIDLSSSKTEVDISLPKGKMEVQQPDAELSKEGIVVKADKPEVDSKGLDVKTKQPSFSLPKFGFSKSDMKAPEADVSHANVEVSLPEGEVDIEVPSTDIATPMDDVEQKEKTKFGSPIKFKLPTITFPKFGTKAPKGAIDIPVVDVQPKGQEISLPDTELKLSAEAPSADIKGSDVDKEKKSLSVNVKTQDIQIKEKGSKFKVPKFGISLPEVKGPEINSGASKKDIDICLPEASMEVHPPHVELPEGTIKVKADIPEVELKGLSEKTKQPGFSFPKFGISTSEMKAPEPDVNLPNVDVPLPEGSVDLKGQNTDIPVSVDDFGQKDETKFGSPTKFKLPSISLPKLGVKTPKGAVEIPAVDVQSKGQEINIPKAELKLSADMKGSDVDKEQKSLSVDVKTQDNKTEEKESKFKVPKFGISLPEVKGPEISSGASKKDIDICLPETSVEVHPPHFKLPEGTIKLKAGVPDVELKGFDEKNKQPGFSFPKLGISTSEMKAPEADVNLPNVDVSLPEGSVDLKGQNTDITVSVGDSGQKDETKFGSPTKFKLPSFTLPKFGLKAPKGAVEIPAVDVQSKGQEINLPEAELKLSADMKASDVDKEEKSLSVDVKTQDIKIEGKDSSFKLPKFGISLPEVKGPKIDLSSSKTEVDISLPEANLEVQPPDAGVTEGAIVVKADVPEVDSKGLDVKTKQFSFSFPKFGFSKSEMKTQKTDVNLPDVDLSVAEKSIDLEGPSVEITKEAIDTKQKDDTKFGSPTKFKLPSISLPKFGVKTPKEAVDISAVDVQTKQTDISLPDAELTLSVKPQSVHVEGPEAGKKQESLSSEMKIQATRTEEQSNKFKLPKFEISFSEVKGPKPDTTKTEIAIPYPEGKMESLPPDVEVPTATSSVEVNLPDMDSTALDVKAKTSSFSFPKFGFSKSQIKVPEGDISLTNVDASGHEKTELKAPITDTSVSLGNKEQKDETKFGSPTKFKLPSITLPKFGAKAPKGTVEVPAVDVQSKGHEISLPDVKLQLSSGPPGKEELHPSDSKMPEKDITDPVDLNARGKHLKSYDFLAEVDIKDTTQPPEAALQKEEEKGSSSRFKLPTIKMSKTGISKTKSQDGDNETNMNVNVPKVILETKHKENTQGQEKSSKFTLGDVLKGFDVEFNVPSIDEIEVAKTETSASVKLENEHAVKEEASAEGTVKQKEEGTQRMKPEDAEKQIKPEKTGWFKFPKFSSPTKTAKVTEKESSQPPMITEESSVMDTKEKELEQSSIREVEEDSVSPTLSLRSSDAFADVSSAQTTEQVALSLASPTKVKVKYSESTATVEVGDLHSDVITSTTRTELISMEPHQPEKVNIPCSSDMSTSSVDTQKEISGEIHRIVSTVQTIPDTQHTTILSNIDTQGIKSLSLEGVTIKSHSVLSVESTSVLREEHVLVEKHIVKEMFGDDKEKVLVTRRIQVFEGDSMSDDAACSVQKLRDTVHTEKMRFFESTEPDKVIQIGKEPSLRHIDSSADENGGK